jgi:hypothetical protein
VEASREASARYLSRGRSAVLLGTFYIFLGFIYCCSLVCLFVLYLLILHEEEVVAPPGAGYLLSRCTLITICYLYACKMSCLPCMLAIFETLGKEVPQTRAMDLEVMIKPCAHPEVVSAHRRPLTKVSSWAASQFDSLAPAQLLLFPPYLHYQIYRCRYRGAWPLIAATRATVNVQARPRPINFSSSTVFLYCYNEENQNESEDCAPRKRIPWRCNN